MKKGIIFILCFILSLSIISVAIPEETVSFLNLDDATSSSSSIETANIKPEFFLDNSAVPFMELQWDIKMNKLAKDLDVKAEKEGNVNILRSAVTVNGLGENLPVVFSFRNNKLASVKLMIKQGYGNTANFLLTGSGQLITGYIEKFVGNHPNFTYYSQTDDQFRYIITDRSEITYGILKNGNSYDLSMEFFPAQKYDTSALKKDNKVSSIPSGENNVIYSTTSHAYFTHPYTYNGKEYSNSYFQWVIMMLSASNDPGKIPVLYYGFTYNGVKNPSATKWLSFTIDGDIYRFEIGEKDLGKLTKTNLGELSQTFCIEIDCNNYAFLERLAKGKKVVVALQGDDFLLNFDLPAKAKQEIITGMKYYEKVCGIIDGPLARNRFWETPLTIY